MNGLQQASLSTVAVLLSMATHAVAQDAAGRLQQTTTKTMETYVPPTRNRVAAIELRGEASVSNADVTLRQVCRWPEADAEAFRGVADLIVLRLAPGKSFESLTLEQVQALLGDAGVNPGTTNFAGAAVCTVSRNDVKVDEAEALRSWIASDPQDAAQSKAARPDDDEVQAAMLADAAQRRQEKLQGKGDAQDLSTPNPSETAGDLRARLIGDIATRLNLPAAKLQVDFRPEDRKLLSLREPFEFSIDPQRFGELGETSWAVTISDGVQAKSQRVRITANARAWMNQVVATKPLDLRQTISEADLEVRHVLADRLPHDALATKEHAIGQQAARDLRAGTVLTGKMLAAPELVRAGQLVTVHMRRGAIDVKSVAVALQSGSSGQSIKVKNDRTNEVFQIILTGQQTGVLSASDPLPPSPPYSGERAGVRG